MSINCPDSAIQVGPVLPTWSSSDSNFIRAVAFTFGALFFCKKKTTNLPIVYSNHVCTS